MGDAVAVWAVVVAAGSGERLGAEHPKAFVAFGDDPLVAVSVGALDDHPAVDGIVLVVPEGWEERATFMCDEIGAGKVAVTVAGGPTRSDSVALGVAEVPDEAALILVHDAARPVLPAELVDRVLAGFADGPDGVVPALELADTVKRVDAAGRVVETLPRAELRAVQTPQGFRADVLRRALAAPDRASGTDCASLVERAGGDVRVVPGDPRCLKVTTRADLERALELRLDG
ncbi:MAG: 2-C-methyl-D-erythritol 4-phosphate cytidylyltransferase [Actinomycetota bacterium]